MNFHKELIPAILAGEKTLTRRPVKYDHLTSPSTPGFLSVERPCKYKVGHTYAVQPVIEEGPGKGRGGKGIARIRILDVRRGLLAGIDDRDAQLEGFQCREDFRRYWIGLYGSFNSTQHVDRIEFELLPEHHEEIREALP